MELYRYPPTFVLLGCHHPVQEVPSGFVVLQDAVVEVEVLGEGEELASNYKRHSKDDAHGHHNVSVSLDQTMGVGAQ